MSTRNLEEAIAFVLQAHERLINVRNDEHLILSDAPNDDVRARAYAATNAAAMTTDAATQELADTIRDMAEDAAKRAVLEIEPTVVAPPGVPYSLTHEVERA